VPPYSLAGTLSAREARFGRYALPVNAEPNFQIPKRVWRCGACNQVEPLLQQARDKKSSPHALLARPPMLRRNAGSSSRVALLTTAARHQQPGSRAFCP